MLVAVNWVEPNRLIGSIGAAVRRSRSTKPASSSTAPISETWTVALLQPADGPSIRP